MNGNQSVKHILSLYGGLQWEVRHLIGQKKDVVKVSL